jgi:putative sporulation protein YtaF
MLFTVSANLDTFVVAATYGVMKLKIKLTSILMITFITSAGTYLSMTFGRYLNTFLPNGASNLIGSVILVGLGLWVLKDLFMKKPERHETQTGNPHTGLIELLKNPEKADTDQSGYIDLKESVILACALTINNIGFGIGASITGLSICFTAVITFLINILFLTAGYAVGSRPVSGFFEKYASLISGIVIILLGVYELLV